MHARVIRSLLATALLLCSVSYTHGACTSVVVEQNDDAYPQMAAKKADYALTVLSDREYLAHDPECVKAAMLYLGMRHIEKAIPMLISLLTYRQGPPDPRDVNHQESQFGHLVTRDEQYPAINGLYAMGKPAIPALVQVLASKDIGSIDSKNALYAFMNIYRGNAGDGIHILERAAERQTDSLHAARLRRAANDAKLTWCRLSPCSR